MPRSSALRWLVEFAVLDLRALTNSQRQITATFAASVALNRSAGERAIVVTKSGKVFVPLEVPAFTDDAVFGAPVELFRPSHLPSLQRMVREALSAARLQRIWKFRAPVHQAVRFSGTSTLREYEGRPLAMFVARVADILVSERDEIRWCARQECARPFMRSGKQTYCSPVCTAKSSLKRFRERNPRDYAAEYDRRWAKKHPGTKAKPKRMATRPQAL